MHESDLDEHPIVIHKATKNMKRFYIVGEFKTHLIMHVLPLKYLGFNLYKIVEMLKNYCPMI